MNTFTFDTHLTADEYDAFVTSRPECNVLQSSRWAVIKNTWSHTLTAVRNESGKILAAGLVLKRPLPLGFEMWYLPHGPILDFTNRELLRFYLRCLATQARNSRAILIKIDPPVALEAAPLSERTGEANPLALLVREDFLASGFLYRGLTTSMHDTLQPRFTTATMRPTEGTDILAAVSKRTRRFVKDAENRYVQVRRVGAEALEDFMYVISRTEEAKSIQLRSRTYYENILHTYGEDALLYMAYLNIDEACAGYKERIAAAQEKLASLGEQAPQKRRELEQQIASHNTQLNFLHERTMAGDPENVPLAGCISVLYGSGLEMLYAGMNRNYAKIPAQDAIYIETMRKAFSRGARYASMGGVANSLDDGLTTFKSHFAPLIIEKLGEFDLPVRPLLYKVIDYMLARR